MHVRSRVNHKSICNTMVNESTVEHCFDDKASNYTNVVLKLCFGAIKVLLALVSVMSREFFLTITPTIILGYFFMLCTLSKS